jgi:serine/threonine protein kinase
MFDSRFRHQTQTKDWSVTSVSYVYINSFLIYTKGAGCFGVVYKGSWKQKTVALKELRDVDQLVNFADEAGKMHALASHKNVVDFYGIGKAVDVFV